MPLVTTKEMFRKAYEGGYAIGAFNVNNMEIVQGITEAAAAEHSAVILQVSAMKIFYKAEIMIYIIDFVLSKKENPKRICQLILSGFRSLIYVISENKNPRKSLSNGRTSPGQPTTLLFFSAH